MTYCSWSDKYCRCSAMVAFDWRWTTWLHISVLRWSMVESLWSYKPLKSTEPQYQATSTTKTRTSRSIYWGTFERDVAINNTMKKSLRSKRSLELKFHWSSLLVASSHRQHTRHARHPREDATRTLRVWDVSGNFPFSLPPAYLIGRPAVCCSV